MKKTLLSITVFVLGSVTLPAQIISTFAGTAGGPGYTDGPAASAQFSSPSGIATNPSNGDVYVADAVNKRIRKISGGTVSTLAGNGSTNNVDGTGAAASFSGITKIVTDMSVDIYVANIDRVRKVTPSGVVTTFISSTALAGVLYTTANITDIVYDNGSSSFWISDFNGKILKATAAGSVSLFTTLGNASNRIIDMAADGMGAAYALKVTGEFIKINSNGTFTILGNAGAGIFSGIAYPGDGNVYISGTSASGGGIVSVYSTAGVLLKTFFSGTPGDVDAISALAKSDGLEDIAFASMWGLAEFYVIDANTNKIRRVQYNPGGSLTAASLNQQHIDACGGQTALFTLSATNATNYQWFKNNVALTNTLNVSGVNTPSLSIANTSAADQATYTVMYANTYSTMVTGASTGQLNVFPTPTVTAAAPAGTIICNGHSLMLNAAATPTGSNTYAWSDASGVVNTNQSAFVSPTVTTTYSVVANNGACNSNAATITVSVTTCTGLTENQRSQPASVYPNPTNGIIYIETGSLGATTIVLNDVAGRTMCTITTAEAKTPLDLSGFDSGIYFLSIRQNGTHTIHKIIKP